MSTKYDQSGKIFSHVISKAPIKVMLQTKTSRIEGELYKKHDERILDALNEGLQFVAVTDAKIYESHAGTQVVREVNFLVVNRDAIEWISPVEEQA